MIFELGTLEQSYINQYYPVGETEGSHVSFTNNEISSLASG